MLNIFSIIVYTFNTGNAWWDARLQAAEKSCRLSITIIRTKQLVYERRILQVVLAQPEP